MEKETYVSSFIVNQTLHKQQLLHIKLEHKTVKNFKAVEYAFRLRTTSRCPLIVAEQCHLVSPLTLANTNIPQQDNSA